MPSPSHDLHFDALGSSFAVRVWDEVSPTSWPTLERDIPAFCEHFESLYSRFRPHSLVRKISKQRGTIEVPSDLVTMLRTYDRLYHHSGGTFTPCVGTTLESMGYDCEYSLTPKDVIAPAPKFEDVCKILDDTHIHLREEVHFDFGGMGKGYCVDRVADMLRERGYKRFLVNGSGDILYQGDGHPIRCGLEHPDDPSKVIGVVELTHGALAASGAKRRRWDTFHHIVNPHSLSSPQGILGTWVLARTATEADAIATCLFLAQPEAFAQFCTFEYCVMSDAYNVQRSQGFVAQLF